jgi:erythromycin esterase-like protein
MDSDIPFSLSDGSLPEAVDRLVLSLPPCVSLLGLCEPLHGGDDFLIARNLIFRALAERHNFRAIALETDFAHSLIVNDYVHGRTSASIDVVLANGFTHGFSFYESNKELVEWLKAYNLGHPGSQLSFYGLDAPTEASENPSPRLTLLSALDLVASVDRELAESARSKALALIGDDSLWQTMEVIQDRSKAIGRTEAANQLRLLVDDLTAAVQIRRPAFGDDAQFRLGLLFLHTARHLLDYQAVIADTCSLGDLLGLRAVIMADNIAHIQSIESGRVLLFAHNGHLQKGLSATPWWQF